VTGFFTPIIDVHQENTYSSSFVVWYVFIHVYPKYVAIDMSKEFLLLVI